MTSHDFIEYALAAQQVLQALGLLYLARRVDRLKREFRKYADWPDMDDFETIAGTGNMHRRKLGWRVRMVMRWIAVREWLSRKVAP